MVVVHVVVPAGITGLLTVTAFVVMVMVVVVVVMAVSMNCSLSLIARTRFEIRSTRSSRRSPLRWKTEEAEGTLSVW